MIYIEGGRGSLYQWDIDQRLIVEHDEVTEVHFSNNLVDPALICEVYEEGGLRYANVPNILLQQPNTLLVHGCCEECVRESVRLRVIPRAKPADYVYTETELLTFEKLQQRAEAAVVEAETAATQAAESAAEAQEALKNVPADYTKLSQEVGKLSEGTVHYRKQVNAPEDLNSITQTGVYRTGSTTNNPANAPSTTGGLLTVVTDGNLVSQTYTLANETYMRFKRSAGWTAWMRLVDTATIGDAINTATSGAIMYRTALTSANDLDTDTQNGIYRISAGSLPKNMPSTEGGLLLVMSNSTLASQIYMTKNANYTRSKTSAGWGAWLKLLDDVAFSAAVASKGALGATYDLNDITQNGIYRLSGGNLPANTPDTVGGLLTVKTNAPITSQTYETTTTVYVRLKSSAGWSTWRVLNKAAGSALPKLTMTGDVSAMSKDNAVTLAYEIFGQTGECTCKWQGSSSQRYAKKNYTIKLDTAIDVPVKWAEAINAFRISNGIVNDSNGVIKVTSPSRWGVQKKFCAKANWIDASHARNVVCARLWGQIVASRNLPTSDKRTQAPNYGAIDGFPIEIIINGVSQGLYTLNIPKDAWQFAMGNGLAEYLVCGEGNANSATQWKTANAVIDDSTDYSLEHAPDGVETSTVATSLNAAINAAVNAGADWATTLAPYVDINSVFDYFIFTCCVSNHDALARNILYGTYDGTKWFMSAYDLDTTFGNNPYSTSWFNVKTDRTQFAEAAKIHRLAELMMTDKSKLAARYKELRATILSEENVWHEFSQFIVDIPSRNYDMDREIWPTIPNTTLSTLSQYMDYYRMHCALLDKEVESWNV